MAALLLFGNYQAKAVSTTDEEPDKASAFEQRIQELGLDEIVNDYSETKKIIIAEPSCAYINITGTDKMPGKKGEAMNVWIEAYLDNGNYFRKRAIIDAQGNSSLRFEKKNFTADFCDDEWIGDETPAITFGDWVKQDSYHFKAYYNDYLRGVAVAGYRLYDQIALNSGRPWTRAVENISKPKENARCYPDGFPCMVYLNGDFYGIFAWQLKKHRDNMNQTKTVAGHIHLDGKLGDETFWQTDSIQWGEFEVRNPKSLYTMDGRKYDGDHPSELIDETSEYFDLEDDDETTKANKERTAQVKRYIVSLSRIYGQMEQMEGEQTDNETLRAFFEEHFDIKSLIDYACFHFAVYNYDGFTKNWQWYTYDGNKWFVAPYDLDCIIGNTFTGNYVTPPDYSIWLRTNGPFYWINKYYFNDIRTRYGELRNENIFSADNICALLEDWYYRVGDNYDYEWQRWPNSICINDIVTGQGWKHVEDTYAYWQYNIYDESKEYTPGERCQLDYLVWEATDTVCGVKPYIRLGYRDSLERYESWVAKRLEIMDDYLNYEPETITTSMTLHEKSDSYIIYDATGRRRSGLNKGLNILLYDNGTVKKLLKH